MADYFNPLNVSGFVAPLLHMMVAQRVGDLPAYTDQGTMWHNGPLAAHPLYVGLYVGLCLRCGYWALMNRLHNRWGMIRCQRSLGTNSETSRQRSHWTFQGNVDHKVVGELIEGYLQFGDCYL